ncbi:hypothetical protein AQUCO_03100078v1 [Aquilegia coerulea]|uniref:Calmodulin-binding protein n=1 Tax=Aquilegia coerulea TaxID=218851 RepID=A0A2G5D0N1_AQUCA|nr:hypothetical protein AQUCO_03100078v1 [Aquilegia coerulea]
MTREKRERERDSNNQDGQPDNKRPALASVIIEALKVDSLQKLCSSLEPILRRVVSEEVERALAKLGPAMVDGRSSPRRIEGLSGRNLQLQFRSRLPPSLFTGGKVEGEQGAGIHAVLLDSTTGFVVTSGVESSAKLEIVVLEGDFNNEDDDNWTQQDFESHVVKEREGKRPLLTGDLHVTLKEGVGTLGELTFTDNSSWIRSRKFRLGLKVASGSCEGTRIREAKTDAFTVKDHRGELYKKHYPPALNDEVWRLEKIGKDGSFHKRLNKAGIYSVEDFLRLVVRDSQRLRSVLGNGMSNKMWEVLIEHAKTCVMSGKIYVYYADDTKHVGVVFNNIYEFSGLIAGEQYYTSESLSESQKVYVDSQVKKAYDNWMHIVEYDGKGFFSFKETRRSIASQSEVAPLGPQDYALSFDPNVLPRVPVPLEQPLLHSSLTVGAAGDYDNPTTRFSTHPQNVNSNSYLQFGDAYTPQSQSVGASHQMQMTRSDKIVGLALGPPQASVIQAGGPSGEPLNLSSYDDWSRHRDNRGVDDLFSEEDIRMRSHEMLENEDMQDLLRNFSMGGHSSISASHDGFPFSPYTPLQSTNYGYDEDHTRSSGKAVVGWLKLKAALRWGIFIRKQAAVRRAQLVELDD